MANSYFRYLSSTRAVKSLIRTALFIYRMCIYVVKMESSLFMFVAKVVRCSPLLKAVCVSVQNMELDPYVHVVYDLH